MGRNKRNFKNFLTDEERLTLKSVTSEFTSEFSNRGRVRGRKWYPNWTPRAFRRAQALLQVDDGESIDVIARLVGMDTRTVYGWALSFETTRHKPTAERLLDKPRHGRPLKSRGFELLIYKTIKMRPEALGYARPFWTPTLIQRCLREQDNLKTRLRDVTSSLKLIIKLVDFEIVETFLDPELVL